MHKEVTLVVFEIKIEVYSCFVHQRWSNCIFIFSVHIHILVLNWGGSFLHFVFKGCSQSKASCTINSDAAKTLVKFHSINQVIHFE